MADRDIKVGPSWNRVFGGDASRELAGGFVLQEVGTHVMKETPIQTSGKPCYNWSNNETSFDHC